jgi:hypothetical protein
MATLVVQPVNISGVVITPVAASVGGDVVPIGEHNCLEVTNGSGSPITVTITVVGADGLGRALSNDVVTVAAGTTKRIGPIGKAFANRTDHKAHVAYSSVTSVTVAVTAV